MVCGHLHDRILGICRRCFDGIFQYFLFLSYSIRYEVVLHTVQERRSAFVNWKREIENELIRFSEFMSLKVLTFSGRHNGKTLINIKRSMNGRL